VIKSILRTRKNDLKGSPVPNAILVLNGPNLNLLGTRQPEIYGTQTLKEIERHCRRQEKGWGISTWWRQSNWEGQMIDWIQDAQKRAAGIVINAGAYAHTSIAILDALYAFQGPVIEVHLSNPSQREDFRKKSFVASRADHVIEGLGGNGYEQALLKMSDLLNKT
jgi:3-dehydroquinate dehydratase II